MPQQAWSDKRERQYDHIKEGLVDQGRSEDTAKEIAGAHRQQGAGPIRRGQASQPHLDRGHLLGPARGSALPPGIGWTNQGTALQ